MTTAPAAILRGDTITWTVPRSLWTGDGAPVVSATLYGRDRTIAATVAEESAVWRVTVPAATAATMEAGGYSFVVRGTAGAVVATLETGVVQVLALPAAGAVSNATHAERMVAALEAQLEQLARDPLESYSVGDRDAKRRDMAQVKRLLAAYRREVLMERNGGRLPPITFAFPAWGSAV